MQSHRPPNPHRRRSVRRSGHSIPIEDWGADGVIADPAELLNFIRSQ